jgi:tetratricopeptide (TPR) repeat protein
MKKIGQIGIMIGLLCVLIFGSGVGASDEKRQYDVLIFHDGFAEHSEQFELIWTKLDEEFEALGISYNRILANELSMTEFQHPYIYLSENDSTAETGIFNVSSTDPLQIANSSFVYTHYRGSDSGSFQLQDTEIASTINAITGFTLYILGDCQQALPYLTSDKASGEEANLAAVMSFYAGNCSLILGEYQDAVAYFTSVLDANYGNHLPSLNNMAWAYLQMGSPEYATSIFDFAIENTAESYLPTLFSHRAQLYALAFDYDSAIADIDSAIESAEENDFDNITLAELYTLRGEIIFLIYEWDRVLDNFNYAIELDPSYAPAYFQRGILYYTMAQRELALADFETYLELIPEGEYAEQAQDNIESIQIEIDTLGG